MTLSNAVLPALDEQQQAVLERTSGQTLLLAVPGSGKTTVLLARIAHLVQDCGVPPESILALSYSRSAAEEMAARYENTYGGTEDSVPAFSTIHAFCLSVLRYTAAKTSFRLPALEPDTASLIRQTLRQIDNGMWPPERLVRALEGKLTQVKNHLATKEELESVSLKDLDKYPGLTFPSFVDQYDQFKRRRNVMDFDDQLLLAYAILLQQPDIADAFRAKYRHICLDEAQDASRLQFKILEQLAKGADSLLIVGDDDQSIYGFRGADPDYLLHLKDFYPDAEILYLTANYRSLPEIVEAANRFISQNTLRYPKAAVPTRTGKGAVTVIPKPTVDDLYQEISAFCGPLSLTDETVAFAARNNFCLLPLAIYLDQHHQPTRRRDNFSSFFHNKAVSGLLAALTLAVEPWNLAALNAAKSLLGIYLSQDQMASLQQAYLTFPGDKDNFNLLDWAVVLCAGDPKNSEAISKACHVFRMLNPNKPAKAVQLLYHIYRQYRPDQSEDPTGSVLNPDTYIGVLVYCAGMYATLADFVAGMWRYANVPNDSMNTEARITLTTIHAAKGMQWDWVVLLDPLDGVLPKDPAGKEATLQEQEEDARLFYVACTRARNHLVVLVPPTLFGVPSRPSSYLPRLTGQTMEELRLTGKPENYEDLLGLSS